MVLPESKKAILERLQKNILQWQGFAPASELPNDHVGLGPIEHAFPNGVFPRAAIHEFLIPTAEGSAASGGFITGILHKLMENKGACIWISGGGTIFPPALKAFGIEPDRVIFVDLQRDKDVLWAMEEALKCTGLAAVIAEVGTVNFMQARRLQLAVEQSKVTGFLLRTTDDAIRSTACTARWRIQAMPSQTQNDLPGVGHPRWRVELLKVRNGQPGQWDMEWRKGRFSEVEAKSIPFENRQAG